MSNQTPPGGGQSGWNDQSGWSGGQSDQGPQNPYAQSGGGQPGQGQPQAYGGYQQQQPTGGSGLAITALVLGIIGLLTCIFVIGGFLFGLPAIIVGAIASSKAKKGRATGRGMAIGGIVLGVISLLISIAISVFAVSIFQKADFGSLQECIIQADGDPSAEADCQRQFEDDLEEQLSN